MASKIDNATLTVQVREEVTLNNRKLGGQNVELPRQAKSRRKVEGGAIFGGRRTSIVTISV